MEVPAVEARVEGRSTVEDRQPRNSCRQVCCANDELYAAKIQTNDPESQVQCPTNIANTSPGFDIQPANNQSTLQCDFRFDLFFSFSFPVIFSF